MLLLDAFVADKADFQNFIKFLAEILLLNKMRKAWRPTKKAPLPTGLETLLLNLDHATEKTSSMML